MPFFEPLPPPKADPETEEKTPADPKPRPEWAGPPADTVPGVVPFRQPLLSTSEIFILVDRILAYPAGLVVELELFLAHPLTGKRQIDGMFPWAIVERQRDRQVPPWARPVQPEDQLRFGILFADGTSVVAPAREDLEDHIKPPRSRRPDGPVMRLQGGGGGSTKFEHGLWIYPFPPPGPVNLAVEWPVFGVPETWSEIPGEIISSAQAEIVELWPDVPTPIAPLEPTGGN